MPRPKPGQPEEPVRLKIKKGDTVEVISGKDKGKRGQITAAYPKLNKVLVGGINTLVHHMKDRPSNRAGATGINQVQKGGRLEKEAPLYCAKVMLVCPKCNRPTRVGFAFHEGAEKPSRRKYRVCKHPDCAKSID
jgi:large subunit ribosomal protein L24